MVLGDGHIEYFASGALKAVKVYKPMKSTAMRFTKHLLSRSMTPVFRRLIAKNSPRQEASSIFPSRRPRIREVLTSDDPTDSPALEAVPVALLPSVVTEPPIDV